MSWLSKGFRKLKKVADTVNPLHGFIRDSVLSGGDVKGAAQDAVGNAKRAQDIGIKIAPIALGAGALGGAGGIAGAGAGAGSAAGAAAPAAASAGGWRSVLGGAKDVYDKIGGIDTILAGGSFLSDLDQQRKADRYNEKAMKMLEADYARRAPFRGDDVLQGLLNETPPDLSDVYAPGSSNAFRRVSARRPR